MILAEAIDAEKEAFLVNIKIDTCSAEKYTSCLRKGVGVSAFQYLEKTGEFFLVDSFHNGGGHCTNEVGNCGCPHAEQRALVCLLSRFKHGRDLPIVLVQTYSPCTTCANLIALSGLVEAVVWKIDTEHDMRGICILGWNNILGVKLT